MDQNQNEEAAKELIKTIFSFLFIRGYQFYDSGYTLTSMGYWEVNLRSKETKIKFSFEDGEIMLAFCSNNYFEEYWFEIGLIIYILTNHKEFIGKFEGALIRPYTDQYKRLSTFVEKYLNEIEQSLGNFPNNFIAELINSRKAYIHLISTNYTVINGRWKRVN